MLPSKLFKRTGSNAVRFAGRVRQRLRRDEGTATVEFVIIFPVFIMVFLATFEAGLFMVRQMMLDRATDLVVRSMRLGQWSIPDTEEGKALVHDQMKEVICAAAAILPDCEENLMIELSPVSKENWTLLPSATTCVDKAADVQPATTFKAGTQHEMMMVRVCALQSPVFPTSTTGLDLATQPTGEYALVSLAAFVNEP